MHTAQVKINSSHCSIKLESYVFIIVSLLFEQLNLITNILNIFDLLNVISPHNSCIIWNYR